MGTERPLLVGGDINGQVDWLNQESPCVNARECQILKHIIHDWNDETAIAILKQCHKVMPDNGKVLVAEQVIPPGNQPFMGKLIDLNMLVMTSGGRERTEAEYRALFEKAGFKLTIIVPTQEDVSIIEGILM